MKKYLGYYNLENHLFDEINKRFKINRHLKPEEFFAIIIWKSNRAKTKVRAGIQKNGGVAEITGKLNNFAKKEKVEFLCGIDGIGIPIASAILTVCYEDEFTVVDYRAKAALKYLGENIHGDPTANVDSYLEYVDRCKKLAKQNQYSLRDIDRILWGIDFYEGKGGLKELVTSLK